MQEVIKNSHIILAIEVSCGMCSVALLKNGKVAAYKEELSVSKQAARLVLMVEEALKESDTKYSDLTKVACGVGPGSFTGIRIALATARAIGFAAEIPVQGFSTLEILAFSQKQLIVTPDLIIGIMGELGQHGRNSEPGSSSPLGGGDDEIKEKITAIINAGKGEIISQDFDAGLNRLNEPSLSKATKTENFVQPRADMLALLAAQYPEKSVAPLPFYVRQPDAKLPSSPPGTKACLGHVSWVTGHEIHEK